MTNGTRAVENQLQQGAIRKQAVHHNTRWNHVTPSPNPPTEQKHGGCCLPGLQVLVSELNVFINTLFNRGLLDF